MRTVMADDPAAICSRCERLPPSMCGCALDDCPMKDVGVIFPTANAYEIARIRELEDENRRLAAFGRQIIEFAFNGTDADGGSIQALALTHGLLRQENYDPEKHGSSLEAEPGGEWFVCVGAVADAPAEYGARARKARQRLSRAG